jgi:iron complex outermembrane receptor protein
MKRLAALLPLFALLAAPAAPAAAAQQTGTIHGTVTDAETGEAVPGAGESVKGTAPGTATGTATDVDGQYELEIPAGRHTLEVVFVGFEKGEKKVVVEAGERKRLRCALAPSTEALDEVAVTGRESAGGATSDGAPSRDGAMTGEASSPSTYDAGRCESSLARTAEEVGETPEGED